MFDGSLAPFTVVPVPASAFDASEFMPFMLRIAANSEGKMKAADVSHKIKSMQWQLWALREGERIEGVVCTEIVQFPRKRALQLVAAISSDWKRSRHVRDLIEAWGRDQGCDIVQAIAGQKWRHMLPGFRVSHMIYEKVL